MTNPPEEKIIAYTLIIPPEAVDGNGHMNNVVYVQWMQDAAVRHFEALGGVAPMQAAGGIWVVRSHKVDYLTPGYAGEEIEVRTWIADVRRVRSLRKYEFIRRSDQKILARGETDWVFLDKATGKPLTIPEGILRVFPASTGDR